MGEKGRDTPLYLAINSSIYDIKDFLLLHPGGSVMLKLYCGVDVTHAWNAVNQNKEAAVVAMLDIYDAKMNLKRPTDQNFRDNYWYFTECNECCS